MKGAQISQEDIDVNASVPHSTSVDESACEVVKICQTTPDNLGCDGLVRAADNQLKDVQGLALFTLDEQVDPLSSSNHVQNQKDVSSTSDDDLKGSDELNKSCDSCLHPDVVGQADYAGSVCTGCSCGDASDMQCMCSEHNTQQNDVIHTKMQEVDSPLWQSSPLSLSSKALGRWGERLVARFMEHIHYEVLEQNWVCDCGEIDIILRHPEGHVVFGEIKTRRSDDCGKPEQAVTPEKLNRYVQAAQIYLNDAHEAYTIDVFSVMVLDHDRVKIDHFKDVSEMVIG